MNENLAKDTGNKKHTVNCRKLFPLPVAIREAFGTIFVVNVKARYWGRRLNEGNSSDGGRIHYCSFRRFTQFDDSSGRVARDANFRDVTAAGIPADDVTGEPAWDSPVVGGGGGAMLLARSRATNCCGSTSAAGNSAP